MRCGFQEIGFNSTVAEPSARGAIGEGSHEIRFNSKVVKPSARGAMM